MNAQFIERHFAKIGARAKVHDGRTGAGVSIDIGRDGEGEFFDISLAPRFAAELSVVDAQSRIRHLLLMSHQNDGNHKFLCGHEERHWFVAAVPERQTVSSVRTAFEALKPLAVRRLQDQLKVRTRRRNRRRNEAFIRQGEWFFVPDVVGSRPEAKMIYRNEPILRGRGKPHYCEELVRTGGELVYVSPRHLRGLTESQYRRLISRQPTLQNLAWVVHRRNPLVYVRGKIRHADHKTIVLYGWHRVLMNTENEAVAMRHVAFID